MPKRRNKGISSLGYSSRKVEVREEVMRFLIVCEGTQTEPNYFQCFRVPKEVISLDVIGVGKNTIGVVRDAIDRSRNGDYDQVWCVFDKDSFPEDDFDNALYLAEQAGISVAYSIEAFEIWYLLHFNYHDTAMSRTEYKKRLSDLLKKEYVKNSPIIFGEIESKMGNAIKHAKRLMCVYEKSSAKNNPSTTVHLLVEELMKYSR